MRHGQQLQLIEKFKYECKAKGYTPLVALKMQENNVEVKKKDSEVRKRREAFRWVRANLISENNSLPKIETVPHLFSHADTTDDDFGGNFHEPATLPNDYLEAICGNLTLT